MIIGLVEHDRGALSKLSLQMLTVGHRLAKQWNVPMHAVLVGVEAHLLADELATYGVSSVTVVYHDRLGDYAPEAWAQGVVELVDVLKPQVVMAAGSDRGNEVMAHIAARSGQPMAANCTEIHSGVPPDAGTGLLLTRVRWGGSLLEEALLHGTVKLLTIAPHVVEPEHAPVSGEVTLHTFTPSLTDKDFRVRVTARVESAGGKVSLVDARVVVGGGRGVGSAEGFKVLEELADLLGGAVGCSRAVTSLGWRPHSDQVGQTGTRIAPDLYIACGISGAVQHMVGCAGARHILAINTDPQAPLLSKASFAIIGDLHEVVPALIEKIKQP